MKIKVKDGGQFIYSFEEYFKSVNDFVGFIESNNKFINPKNILNKVLLVYESLKNSQEEIKSSILSWRVNQEFNFKFKRPVKLEFWQERGFGLDDFNDYILSSKTGNNQFKNQKTNKNLNSIEEENEFEYSKFKFKSTGHPKCNLCNSNLDISPTIGRYVINGCSNDDCETNKNLDIISIRQLAFLPTCVFKNKNNKVDLNSKLNKEYWLLGGYSYEESMEMVNRIKKEIEDVSKNTSKFYEIVHGLSIEDAKFKLKNKTVLSDFFWTNRGYSEEKAREIVQDYQIKNSLRLLEKRKNNPELYSAITQTQIGYWLNKGYSEEDAKERLSGRQKTFSLDICMEKYGEEDGKRRWLERQEKWHSNYKKSNFSKVSQKLFWEVYNNLSDEYKSENEIYFATLGSDKLIDESGSNNEYRLMLEESFILPDFFVKNKNKIIEFDGTYYHRDNVENKKRELKRDESIVNSGYDVLHVNESKYNIDKQKIIDKCLKFLNTL